MPMTERELLRRARRAYEWGRLKRAARVAGFVVPMAALALLSAGTADAKLAAGAVLLGLTVAFGWRGGVAARAVAPGLLAGSPALLLPLVARTFHVCVGGSCAQVCLASCGLGGLLAGGVLLWTARRQPRAFGLYAAAIASAAGAMGCVVVGAAGVLAMAAALVVLSAPAVLGTGSTPPSR